MKRRREVPTTTRGPPWLRELLQQMLAISEETRPPALEVADAFARQGIPLPVVTPIRLYERARRIHVPRPRVDMDPEAVAFRAKAVAAVHTILMDGAGA